VMHAGPLTVRQAVQHAQAQGLDRLDAQQLLLHALQRAPDDRAWLLAHDGDALSPAQAGAYAALCHRRLDCEPLAYLTGYKAFYGLQLQVDARVLDPRADTETLVDWALECSACHRASSAWCVADLGTGSGAIALALQSRCPNACVWALDASGDALAVARANAHRLRLPLRLLQGHWLHALPGDVRLHCIVSNPPYIRAGDPHLPALRHEPQQALVGGADGLDAIRTIVRSASAHIHAGGWLLLEHGFDQAQAVAQLLRAHGWAHVQHRRDLSGTLRCTGGQWCSE